MRKLTENEIIRTLAVLQKHYEPIPLEAFENNPYKILISTLMSARTNDDTTFVASSRLFEKAPTIFDLLNLPTPEIEKLIYPVGFYKTKAKHINKLSRIVVEEFKGNVPKSRERLMLLPGVGRKTANLVLNRAFGYPAIAVDTHVHRITNMLGWVSTKTPIETEKELMRIIPQKYWTKMNKLFVSLGRKYRSKIKLNEFLIQNNLIKTQ